MKFLTILFFLWSIGFIISTIKLWRCLSGQDGQEEIWVYNEKTVSSKKLLAWKSSEDEKKS
jgi:hypothetical protein